MSASIRMPSWAPSQRQARPHWWGVLIEPSHASHDLVQAMEIALPLYVALADGVGR